MMDLDYDEKTGSWGQSFITEIYFSTDTERDEFERKLKAGEIVSVVHGRWIPVSGGQHKCSRCHTVRKTDTARDHYCPNCGAKMD